MDLTVPLRRAQPLDLVRRERAAARVLAAGAADVQAGRVEAQLADLGPAVARHALEAEAVAAALVVAAVGLHGRGRRGGGCGVQRGVRGVGAWKLLSFGSSTPQMPHVKTRDAWMTSHASKCACISPRSTSLPQSAHISGICMQTPQCCRAASRRSCRLQPGQRSSARRQLSWC